MVELTLENLQTDGMPVDCFISVRVGDQQKLSRLSAARVFKFPHAGDRRFGKIEVFRRIGACSVDVDPARGGPREVSVNCAEAGFGNLGLKMAIGGEAVKQHKIDEAGQKKIGGREKAAKEYLAKYGLEIQLSEAMQALLKERPENPAEFLASKLLAKACPQGVQLPPMPPTGATTTGLGNTGMDFRKPVDAQFQSSAAKKGPQKLEPLGASQPAQTNIQSRDLFAPPVPPPPAPKAAVALGDGPFAQYHQAHFGDMGPNAWRQLHARFPKAVARAAPTVDSVHAWNMKPSVGTWISHDPKSQGSGRVAPQDWRFKPSVGTWMMPLEERRDPVIHSGTVSIPAASSIGGPDANYIRAPSVGTWLVHVEKEPDQSCEVLPQSQFLPSVGTWLVHVEKEPDDTANMPLEQAQKPLSCDDLPKDGGPRSAFKLAPSVGTWIAAPAQLRANVLTKDSASGHGAVQPQSCFRPSVGTWLVSRIEEKPEPWTVAVALGEGPFATYHRVHFGKMGPDAWKQLHAKFPKRNL